jgi:hypothetical protein
VAVPAVRGSVATITLGVTLPAAAKGAIVTEPVDQLRADVPHSARVWNVWLGGKDNFEVDRQVAAQVEGSYPEIVQVARESRKFLVRAIHYLHAQGIRQYLDIGTGLPTADNTHEVAQRLDPTSRIVYVDNDPLVLVHARALLTSTSEGATTYVDADVNDPLKILNEARATLDFDQPVALILLGILGNVADTATAREIVRTLVDAVPSGSYLVVNDGTTANEASVAGAERSAAAGHPYQLRSIDEIRGFFDGLELVEPGVVPTPLWRPDSGDEPAELAVACGVFRKS